MADLQAAGQSGAFGHMDLWPAIRDLLWEAPGTILNMKTKTKAKTKRGNEQMTKSGSNALLLLEQFEAAVLDALEKAGLSSSVSVVFACCGAARRAVELDNISAAAVGRWRPVLACPS